MTDLYEHVRQLAREYDVELWVCETCPDHEVEGEAYLNGHRAVFLTQAPDTPEAYLVALHELGHHAAHPWGRGRVLDHEAAAWRWAIEQATIPLGPDEWRVIYQRLKSWKADRRYRQTYEYLLLLDEAASRTLPAHVPL